MITSTNKLIDCPRSSRAVGRIKIDSFVIIDCDTYRGRRIRGQ
jgi:hypothetical protein